MQRRIGEFEPRALSLMAWPEVSGFGNLVLSWAHQLPLPATELALPQRASSHAIARTDGAGIREAEVWGWGEIQLPPVNGRTQLDSRCQRCAHDRGQLPPRRHFLVESPAGRGALFYDKEPRRDESGRQLRAGALAIPARPP